MKFARFFAGALALCALAFFSACRVQGHAVGDDAERVPQGGLTVFLESLSVAVTTDAAGAAADHQLTVNFTREEAFYTVDTAASDVGKYLSVSVSAEKTDTEVTITSDTGQSSGGTKDATLNGVPAPAAGAPDFDIVISLEAADGDTSEYRITIRAPQSTADDDYDLKSLEVIYVGESGNLISFNKSNVNYSVPAAEGKTQVKITAQAVSSASTVEIKEYQGSAIPGGVVSLPTAAGTSKKIEVVVTSGLGSAQRYYITFYPYVATSRTWTVTLNTDGLTEDQTPIGVTVRDSAFNTQNMARKTGTAGYVYTVNAALDYLPQAFMVSLTNPASKNLRSKAYQPAVSTDSPNITLTLSDAEVGIAVANATDLAGFDATANYALSDDIDMNDYAGTWSGPTNFEGKFYGNGYAINNLSFTTSGGNTGLFNSVKGGAEIYDLTVNVPDNGGATRVTLTGQTARFGMIVGQMNISGTIKFENVTVKGKIYVGRGAWQYLVMGGFIGEMNQGGNSNVIFKNCVSNLDIDIDQVVGTGNTAENIMCGSFIGRDMNGVELRNSYATGTIKVNTSKTNANLYVGGLIGRIDNNNGTARIIENCYSSSPIEVIRAGTNNYYFLIGGFVGVAVESNAISITNSAALNPSIKAFNGDGSAVPAIGNYHIGRVIGYLGVAATLSDNVALDSMSLNDGATTVDDGEQDNKNGEDVSATDLANPAWWQTAPLAWLPSIWDFSSVSSGKPPVLKK
jgi:hypothetical protein